ncbi:hypothetical protein LIER_21890 [Lithospermum erythrorhizon]|uniref:Retroviral polymerase SH3-like domain-containing protein n=1 Tax=Lithospermum erythrorhizon TaxID=34254 RepID=A0AAV3QSY4_LITER
MSKTYIFIGLNEGTKDYRLYDVETGKVVISRDVLFEEGKQWSWKNSQVDTGQNNMEWDTINDSMLKETHTNDPTENQDNEEPVQAEDQHDTQAAENGDSVAQGRVTTRQGRAVRQPIWMSDYTTGEEISDDEVNIVLGSDIEDPFTFEKRNVE